MAAEKLYTAEQAAEVLMVNSETVRLWLRAGKLKGVKAGRLWRVKESDLEDFLRTPQGETDRPYQK